jgi:hypothetical protein
MSDTRTGQERVREVVIRDDPTELTEFSGRRSILATGLTLLAACVALFCNFLTATLLRQREFSLNHLSFLFCDCFIWPNGTRRLSKPDARSSTIFRDEFDPGLFEG